MSTGYGIPWRIDGPPPVPRRFGLLQAADAPAAGVRFVVDLDGTVQRWENGVTVLPFPPDLGGTWDPCAAGTMQGEKDEGDPPNLSDFGAFTVHVPVTCSSIGVGDDAAFRARAAAALAAREGRLVEREFMLGELMASNPHLTDDQATTPNGNTVTDPVNGVALLERAIADTGAGGLIHVTPEVATALSARGDFYEDGGVLRTRGNGTVVIPGAGYTGANPDGHTVPSGTQDWIYATGPVDIRRSEVYTVPGTLAEALDRETNVLTFRAEREYLVIWDAELQAAVLVDRCSTTC